MNDEDRARDQAFDEWAAKLRELDEKMEGVISVAAGMLPTIEAGVIPPERADMEELRQRFVSTWGPVVRHWRDVTSRVQRPS